MMKIQWLKGPLLGSAMLLCASTFAQLKKPVSPQLTRELEKVLQDYPDHFAHLRGNEVEHNPQSVGYESTVKLAGSEYCMVTSFKTPNRDIVSWEALMLRDEEFETAEKKFRELYLQLTNARIRYSSFQTYDLKGEYQPPSQSIGFTSVFLKLDPSNNEVKDLRVELRIDYEFPEWIIRIQVYGKDHVDEVSGDEERWVAEEDDDN